MDLTAGYFQKGNLIRNRRMLMEDFFLVGRPVCHLGFTGFQKVVETAYVVMVDGLRRNMDPEGG